MKQLRVFYLLLPVIALGSTGCATLIDGRNDVISINSVPVDGADCELTSNGNTYEMTTPGTILVEKTKRDMKIVCRKTGYLDSVATIPSNLHGTTFGNLVAGGLAGFGVDAITGATFKYPKTFAVSLTVDPKAPRSVAALR